MRSQLATCRQTMEALTRAAVYRLAADGYNSKRMATIRSGWLDLARYFRNTSPKVVYGR